MARLHGTRYGVRSRLALPARAVRRSYGHSRLAYGKAGFAYGRTRLAARSYRTGRLDALIRNQVGPRASYVQTSTAARSGAVQTGSASYYSGSNRTASGGFVGAATCAHRTLPFGTRVLVTNLANAHQTILTVNDRGPFARGRIVDVSTGAASVLGMMHSGTAPVRVQVVGGPG